MKIYCYQKGFLHSKLVVSDDSLATVGSTNMDFRSFEHNFEVNAFMYDRISVLMLKDVFLSDQKDARLLPCVQQVLTIHLLFRIILQYTAVFQPRVPFPFQGNTQYNTNRPLKNKPKTPQTLENFGECPHNADKSYFSYFAKYLHYSQYSIIYSKMRFLCGTFLRILCGKILSSLG